MSNPLSINEKPHTTGLKDATNHIGNILLQQRFDVGPALFDEALYLCNERKFSAAADRLRMLRCLDPSHVDGIVLLCKILARLDQWDEASSILSSAIQQKMNVSKELKDAIEGGRKRFKAKESQQHLHNIQKLKDQLKKVRSEFKGVDSENNQNIIKITRLEQSLQKWSRTCALVTGITIALLFFSWQIDSGTSNAASTNSELQNTVEIPPPPPSAEINEPNLDPMPVDGDNLSTAKEIKEPQIEVVEEIKKEEPEPEPVVEPEPPQVQYPTVHVVRSGDTLSEIAEKYYKRQSLGSWLGEQNNTTAQSLQLGQELLIPSPPPEE